MTQLGRLGRLVTCAEEGFPPDQGLWCIRSSSFLYVLVAASRHITRQAVLYHGTIGRLIFANADARALLMQLLGLPHPPPCTLCAHYGPWQGQYGPVT